MSGTLPENVVEYIKQVKVKEQEFLDLIQNAPEESNQDLRWKAIAKTHIQEGRMACVRSVTEK